MRKVLTVAAATVALTAATVTPAVAHTGAAGPFSTLNQCNEARKKYMSDGHKTTECTKTSQGLMFKYYH